MQSIFENLSNPLFAVIAKFAGLFVDVEALEGYADALTEVGGLTPEHHQAIATKLALDLMDDLNVEKQERSDLLKQETAFIKDAEIAYVRSKRFKHITLQILLSCCHTLLIAETGRMF